ncbi:hypothetical protein CC188_05905 [Campylobacter coli]|nr:hypothetical protein [Campylobacter coli]
MNSIQHKKIIISDRWDGFGERILSMLNAMYVADRFGYQFGFIWRELKKFSNCDNKIISPELPCADAVFDKVFLEKYLYNNINPSYNDSYWWALRGRKLEEVLLQTKEEIVKFSLQGDLSSIFIDVEKKEYYNKIQYLFNSISFEENIKESILCALKIFNQMKDYAAMHIRGGDIIYDSKLTYQFRLKVFPSHLACHFIEKSEDGKKIILFGNDLELNIELRKKFSKKKKVFLLNEIIPRTYNNIQRIFFEIILMSKSDILYTTGTSGFSNLASRIGQSQVVSFYTNYTEKWIYAQLSSGLTKYKFNSMQTSFSYLMLYYYADKLFKSNLIKTKILINGLRLNNSHYYIFSILYIDLLLKARKYYYVDMHLLNLDVDFFCKILLQDIHGSFFYSCYWIQYFNDFKNHQQSILILYLKLKISDFIINNKISRFLNREILSFYEEQNVFFLQFNIRFLSFVDFLCLLKNNINKLDINYYQYGYSIVNNISVAENTLDGAMINFNENIVLNKLIKKNIFYKFGWQLKYKIKKWGKMGYIILLYKLLKLRKQQANRKFQ